MTKQQVYDIETGNDDAIHLFREGTFWIAYERSAFRFVRSFKSYRVTKKYIQNIGRELVSLGFPGTILASLACEFISQGAAHVVLRSPWVEQGADEFAEWKAGVELLAPKAPKVPKKSAAETLDAASFAESASSGALPATPPAATPEPSEPPITPMTTEASSAFWAQELVTRLRDFNLESKTPMECMFFVAELKKKASENSPGSHTS